MPPQDGVAADIRELHYEDRVTLRAQLFSVDKDIDLSQDGGARREFVLKGACSVDQSAGYRRRQLVVL